MRTGTDRDDLVGLLKDFDRRISRVERHSHPNVTGTGGGGTGPQGPMGPAGPPGATGPTGPAGAGADEVSIGPTEPTVSTIELWFDPDATSTVDALRAEVAELRAEIQTLLPKRRNGKTKQD